MIEQVIVVDSNDCEIGVAEKLAAHQQGLCHRAFSIFVFGRRQQPQRLLLQQRHQDKYHSAGLWSNTCCGHPRPGELIEAAASRRLNEELGLIVQLDKVDVFHYRAQLEHGLIENEIDHLFIGFYHGESMMLHPQEVAQTAWVTITSLKERLLTNRDNYTAWLAQGLEKVLLST
ncbi:MAG: isopentenyl-diphosphate Delta-isomerase [Gammaproteobacteria bacterium]|nr:isopentenyl-diphosphate Delta-isomerase [Gammaproteobacteria bacterium]